MWDPASSSKGLDVFLAISYPFLPSEAYQVNTFSSDRTTSGLPSPFKSSILALASLKSILGRVLKDRSPYHLLSSSNSKYPLGSASKLTNCFPPSPSRSANCKCLPSPANEGLVETNLACSKWPSPRLCL